MQEDKFFTTDPPSPRQLRRTSKAGSTRIETPKNSAEKSIPIQLHPSAIPSARNFNEEGSPATRDTWLKSVFLGRLPRQIQSDTGRFMPGNGREGTQRTQGTSSGLQFFVFHAFLCG